jgi:hypothetical protein
VDDDEVERRPAWTPERVRAHLESLVCQAARLLRRARWLAWLSESALAWPAGGRRRRLVVSRGRVVESDWIDGADAPPPPRDARRPLAERRRDLDLAAYDRLRVLTTELRPHAAGAVVRLGLGAPLAGAALGRVLDRV